MMTIPSLMTRVRAYHSKLASKRARTFLNNVRVIVNSVLKYVRHFQRSCGWRLSCCGCRNVQLEEQRKATSSASPSSSRRSCSVQRPTRLRPTQLQVQQAIARRGTGNVWIISTDCDHRTTAPTAEMLGFSYVLASVIFPNRNRRARQKTGKIALQTNV